MTDPVYYVAFVILYNILGDATCQCFPYEIVLIELSQQALQSLHSLSCFAAGQLAPELTTSEELGQEAGARWSTMGALNLMTKLSGFSDR